MSKVRELLKSIKVVPAADDSGGNTCCKIKVSDYVKINQALTLLEQQPAVGEFTKDCRDLIAMPPDKSLEKYGDLARYIVGLEEILELACDRLDRAEAEAIKAKISLNY